MQCRTGWSKSEKSNIHYNVYVPGTALRASCKRPHFWSCKEENGEREKLSHLPKVTGLLNNAINVQTKIS